MNWATRAGVHIDRAACAWLIRRFIDSSATFTFVADPAQVPADATPFDMPGAGLSHHTGPGGAEECSFETFLRRYHLDDPLLWRIAQAVHEADLDDERFDAPEARGLDVVLRGLSMTRGDPAGHGPSRPCPAARTGARRLPLTLTSRGDDIPPCPSAHPAATPHVPDSTKAIRWPQTATDTNTGIRVDTHGPVRIATGEQVLHAE